MALLRIILLAALTVRVVSAEEPTLEYPVKAACLYWFANFVEWPATNSAPIRVGILGDDPFGKTLEKSFAGKKAHDHELVIVRDKAVEKLRDCHIIFISLSEKERLPAVLGELKGRSVLTVGEWPEFLEHGGMIRFLREGKNVKFEINLPTARAAGLKLDANLLRAAKRVISKPEVNK